ncbi:MAG: Rieske 2Fe-2S domain-containing protein [Actinomycetota bacterium]|nr:Rieske 2Fe-2S domain-containing protein [Actinomycetota bacterium]
MRATSIGHAGILVETTGGSILCDPWFHPAFFGSWFPFPRNDQLDDDLLARIESADLLYVSHLHGDHHDAPWLRQHLRRDIGVLLPDYPTDEQRRTMIELGFTEFIHTRDGVECEVFDGVQVAIHVETSITDGPGGDSAIVIADATGRLVNQNDCRTTDLGALAGHGPVDLHWLQYSGAIWYPMVYDFDPDEMQRQCAAKVDSQGSRAMRYVEAIDASAVVPSAGPPVFLDHDLAHLNMVTGDEASIFPDQRWFHERLAADGRNGIIAVPGTCIEVISPGMPATVTHPMSSDDVDAIFTDKATYLAQYRADWDEWLAAERATWSRPGTDLVATLADWWEPLMRRAPTVCAGIGAPIALRAMAGYGADEQVDVTIIVDPMSARVFDADDPAAADLTPAFRFDIPRDLLECVVADRAVDWSNSLLLSCRFRAWRAGPYNEFVYNFLKSLSIERMARTEAEARRRAAGADSDGEEIVIGPYTVQRRCPHRDADLSIFGEIDGDDLVCTLHGWRFDVNTGACRTSKGHQVSIRRHDPS